jgi:hypothetical protein
MIGTPFRHAGRNHAGVDCAGLLMMMKDELGLDFHDTPIKNYDTKPGPVFRRFMERQARDIMSTTGEVWSVGDWIMVWIDEEGVGQHIAVITKVEPLTVIHADTAAGKVWECLFDPSWLSRVVAVFRLKELD